MNGTSVMHEFARYLGFKPEESLPTQTGRSGKDSYFLTQNSAVWIVFAKQNQQEYLLPILTELGKIGITPELLFYRKCPDFPGSIDTVQRAVNGAAPTKEYISENYHLFANVFRKLHADRNIRLLLQATFPYSYEEHIDAEIKKITNISQEIKRSECTQLKNNMVTEVVLGLINSRKLLGIHDLVPVHEDPNNTNFLVDAENKVYLLDWDDVLLADELRDISMVLWRYVDETNWVNFLRIAGIETSDQTMLRIYWWVCRSAFEIAWWFEEHGLPEERDEYIEYMFKSHEQLQLFSPQPSASPK